MKAEEIWNDPTLWEQYGRSSDYQERIQVIKDLIPQDVSSILDIGCGSGDILNALVEDRKCRNIIGVDLSKEALSYVHVPRIVGRLPYLPFFDRSFDLVICLEVIEHLDPAVYFLSLHEIQRLAIKYLIIGVPYRENLVEKQVFCTYCQKTFHADGHFRSYDRSDILSLFGEFEPEKKIAAGVIAARRPTVGTWFDRKLGKGFYRGEEAVCLYCGAKYKPLPRSKMLQFLGKVSGVINDYLMKLGKPIPYWLICLYRRRPSTIQG